MRTKFYKSNIFFIFLSYFVFLISLYFVVFTYWETVSLITSTIVSILLLIYVIQLNPAFFSILFAFLLLIINSFCVFIDIKNTSKINTEVESFIIKGEKREYRYYIPHNFEIIESKKCIIALHGFLQTASTMERLTRFNYFADTLGFLIVYPEGYKKSWNDGDDTKPATSEKIDDIGFISNIIESLKKQYSIEKFYLIGFSNGGFLAVSAACSLNNLIDGFAIVAAGTWKENLKNCNGPMVSKSVFVLMEEDPLTKWQKFKNSVDNYLKEFECYSNTEKDNVSSNSIFTMVDYKCDKTLTRQVIFKKGGHVWPGGEQYLPSFLIGESIETVDASKLILDFLIRDIK